MRTLVAGGGDDPWTNWSVRLNADHLPLYPMPISGSSSDGTNSDSTEFDTSFSLSNSNSTSSGDASSTYNYTDSYVLDGDASESIDDGVFFERDGELPEISVTDAWVASSPNNYISQS